MDHNPNKPQTSVISNSGNLEVRIETERLIIQSYKDCDFEECVQLYSDPILTKYFDHGKPRSREEVKKLITEKTVNYFTSQNPFGLFSIFTKEDMQFIGQIDLIPFENSSTLELGFILFQKYQKNGFCREAAKALIFQYLETINQTHKIEKIIATTHPKNLPSQNILEKLGMKFEKSQDRFNNPRLWYSIITKKKEIQGT